MSADRPTPSTATAARSASRPRRSRPARLLDSQVTLCGCGALGTVLANDLVRAGVGYLRIVDRDFIETHNLQRQVLFDEHDVAENLPKAEAAARKLRRSTARRRSSRSSPTSTAPTSSNCRRRRPDPRRHRQFRDPLPDQRRGGEAGQAVGLRRLIGSHGQTMTILPGETPCLRCVFEAAPPPGRRRPARRPACSARSSTSSPAPGRRGDQDALRAAQDAVNRDLIRSTSGTDVPAAQDRPAAGQGRLPVLPAPAVRVAGGRPGLAHDQPVRPQRRAGRHRRAEPLNFEEMASHLASLGEVSTTRSCSGSTPRATSSPSSPTAGRSSRGRATWTRRGRCMRSLWGAEARDCLLTSRTRCHTEAM